MFCNISISYKLIKLFYATPKYFTLSSLIECLKNLENFNRLYPLHFGTLFAVPDKVQLVKTLFKDFLN